MLYHPGVLLTVFLLVIVGGGVLSYVGQDAEAVTVFALGFLYALALIIGKLRHYWKNRSLL